MQPHSPTGSTQPHQTHRFRPRDRGPDAVGATVWLGAASVESHEAQELFGSIRIRFERCHGHGPGHSGLWTTSMKKECLLQVLRCFRPHLFGQAVLKTLHFWAPSVLKGPWSARVDLAAAGQTSVRFQSCPVSNIDQLSTARQYTVNVLSRLMSLTFYQI